MAWPTTLFFFIFGSTHHIPCHQILQRQYHNGRHKQPSCPLTSWSHKKAKTKKPQDPLLLLSPFTGVEVGEHLCLLKSKSNTPPWQFLSRFLLPQHSAVAHRCPWLFIRLLTFQEVSYDSEVGMESPEAALQHYQLITQAKRTEEM